MSGMSRRDELKKLLDDASYELQTATDGISDRVYKVFEGICSTLTAFRQSNGQKGWAARLQGPDGQPLFSGGEQEVIETTFATLEPNFGEKVQSGGLGSTILTSKIPSFDVDPEKVSLDEAFFAFKKGFAQYQNQFREIASQIGVADFIQEGPDAQGIIPMPPPIPPIPWYISRRMALPLLSLIIESLRFWIAIVPIDLVMFRFCSSFAQTLLDCIRGDLKQAILSSLGLFSHNGLRFSLISRFIVTLLSFISPDLQDEFVTNLYKSSKSFILGITLWIFGTFAPDKLRLVVEASFTQMRTLVDSLNEKIQAAEDKAQAVSEKAGFKVEFPKVPAEFIPTLDNIQALQILANKKEIVCSPEFREITKPLKIIPPLRFILDLLNVPTVEDDVDTVCKNVDTSGISKTIEDAATPKVTMIPGGLAEQAAKAKEAVEQAKELATNPQAALGKMAELAGVDPSVTAKLKEVQEMAADPKAALGKVAELAGVPADTLEKLEKAKELAANPQAVLQEVQKVAEKAGLPISNATNALKKLNKARTTLKNPKKALEEAAKKLNVPTAAIKKLATVVGGARHKRVTRKR